MKKKNFVFMGFAAGNVSTESTAFSRYSGVAAVKILGVNPDAAKLSKIYNTEIGKEPVYVSKVNIDGKEYDYLRVDFIIKTDPAKSSGINLTSKVSFGITKRARYNRDNTLIQMIDKYGNTAWLPIEEAKSGKYARPAGSLFTGEDMRPIMPGEEQLTSFMRAYLNIPLSARYVEKQWVAIENPDKALARFDNLTKYFQEGVKEIDNIVASQPDNLVYVLFGVKTTDENKQYQDVFIDDFGKYNAPAAGFIKRLTKKVAEMKAVGKYAKTEFTISELKKFEETATNFGSGDNSGGIEIPHMPADMVAEKSPASTAGFGWEAKDDLPF